MAEGVEIEVIGHVAHIQLARPEKMNAINPSMFDALSRCESTLRNTPFIRAAVISGQGKAFCAGLDLQSFDAIAQGNPPVDLARRTHGGANFAQYVALQWRQLAIPVIAAIHGVAFGGGLQIALGADMRVVAPSARLSFKEISWGLIPDMGGMLLSRGLIRPDIAYDLMLTGRVFDGAEAERHGLVTRLCDDPIAAALALAAEIAAKNPDAVRAIKRISNIGDDSIAAQILAAEAAEQTALMGSANQIEAMRAAFEKRAPLFQDKP